MTRPPERDEFVKVDASLKWVKVVSIDELVDWLEAGERVAVCAYRIEDVQRNATAVLEVAERRGLDVHRDAFDPHIIRARDVVDGPGFVATLVGGYVRAMPVDRVVGPWRACQSVGLLPRGVLEPAR